MTRFRQALHANLAGAKFLADLNRTGKKWIAKLLGRLLVAPQFKVQAARFSMQIHWNSGKIELRLIYGDKKETIISI